MRHGVTTLGWWAAGEGARREPAVNTTGAPRLAAGVAVAVSSPSHLPGAPLQEKTPRTFRHVLVRVMAMQVATLAFLAWLQYHYGR